MRKARGSFNTLGSRLTTVPLEVEIQLVDFGAREQNSVENNRELEITRFDLASGKSL